jgi:hypothetical protein
VNRTLTDPLRLVVLAGFGLGAAGIVAQILGGWPYPAVPPGLLIALAGGASALGPGRWPPAVAVVAGAFLTVGFVLVGDVARLVGDENALVTVGKWVQGVGVAAGLLAAVASLVRPPP